MNTTHIYVYIYQYPNTDNGEPTLKPATTQLYTPWRRRRFRI